MINLKDNTINILYKHEVSKTDEGTWYVYEMEDTESSLGTVTDRGNNYVPVFKHNNGIYDEGSMTKNPQEAMDHIKNKLDVV